MGFFDRLLGRQPSPVADAATPPDAGPAAEQLSDAERARATERLEQIRAELPGAEESWRLHEEAGILHERLGDLDAAIAEHETALAEHTRYGESYNRLMSLCNTKLSQASARGDGDAIDQWMSKIDELLATSKRIMRENY